MKKIFKTLIILFLFIPFISVEAKVEDVNYKVNKLYMNAEIEFAGSVKVRELIELEGSFNGYIRDIYYKVSDKAFTEDKDSLVVSDIYNGTNIEGIKYGIFRDSIDSYEDFNNELIENNITYYSGSKYLEVSRLDGGISAKMYNETHNSKSSFYLEYVITNVIVEHTDVAEFYYPFIGDSFDDDIKEVVIQVTLPGHADELRIWGHGPLDGEAVKLSEDKGALFRVNGLNAHQDVDIRMVYSKSLFPVSLNESKKSHMEALPLIIEIETEKADEANRKRAYARIGYYTLLLADLLFLAGLAYVAYIVYKKYDKEEINTFNQKYNREFIDDYNVEIVDYIMNKSISSNAFSAAILDLVYKKIISVEKAGDKDYLFTKVYDAECTKNEERIIKLLFIEIGNGKEVYLSEIKKAAKNSANDGDDNVVYNAFNSWKSNVEVDAKSLQFYVDNKSIKVKYTLFGALGLILTYISGSIGMSVIIVAIIALSSIVFIIYVLSFQKRTTKGNDHYQRWKAFKNFLNDFGTFEDKELPEIVLWERYLVYATVFGLADKVQKAMQIKFKNINAGNTMINDPMFNYIVYSDLSSDVAKGINSSVAKSISTVQAVKSSNSSGSGVGGGFSGGSFGGSGGGGRGF